MCSANNAHTLRYFFVTHLNTSRCRLRFLSCTFTLDVNLPACQLRSESCILTCLTDCQRKLCIRYNYERRLVFHIHIHANNFRRAEAGCNVSCRIFAVTNDINFLAADFVADDLYTSALCTDTCTLCVYVFVIGMYGNLCSGTCFAANALDFNRTVSDFRNFRFKQLLYKTRVGTGNQNRNAGTRRFLPGTAHALLAVALRQRGHLFPHRQRLWRIQCGYL